MEYDSCDSRNESEDDDEGVDDSEKSALLRPYAYAFARLRKTKDTFLYTLKCPSDVAPPRIHIGRTALAWPLTKAQEKRLQKRYATDTIIPAAEFSIDDVDDWWASSGETVLIEGRVALGLKSSVAIGVTLSHLAIDVSGNGDVLRAQQTAPNTFGSVIFVLPSTHKGGRITFTHGHETETLYAASASTGMHAAMTYLQTWITSTRLTSGRRYALVFNLVALGDAVPSMPPKMLEAIDMFQALAARPIQRHRRIGRALKPINPRLSWDKLSYADSYLVDVLLATGAFDVALVRFRKVPDDQDMYFASIDEFDAETKAEWEFMNRRHENHITSCVPHPSCSIPESLLEDLKHQSVHTLPECPRAVRYAADLKCSPTALVFWPNQYRAEITGINFALSNLKRAMENPSWVHCLLGLATVWDLAASVVAIFGCGTFEDGIPTSNHSRTPDGYTKTMADLLLALDDVSLVDSFLRDAVHITQNTPVDDVAPAVHTLLHRFGWSALADAMFSLVRRWLYVTTGPLLQLLLSLAGHSAQPVCAKLQEPFFGEWLKQAWSFIVLHPHLQFRCHGTTRVAVVRDLVLLDAYVMRDVPRQPIDNYLGMHLPPALIASVDDCLHGGCHVVDAVLDMYASDQRELLSHLSEALVEVLATYPTMELAPFTDILLAAYDKASPPSEPLSHSMSLQAFASFLAVLDADGRCGDAFVASLWVRWGLSNGPDACDFVKPMPSVSVRLQRRVATLLVHDAPTLAQCQDEFQEVQDRPRSGTRCVKMLSRDVPTKRGLAVLATLAPSAIPTFAPAWLAALPPTIETTRDLLFPIVGWAHDRLEQTHRDAVSCLAAECLGRLLAARVPVCANPALVMSDMELRKEHCAQCQQVAAFLRDNTKACVIVQARSYDVCPIVRKLVTAHKDRLYFATNAFVHGMHSPATVIRKVLPSAGGPRADAPNDDQVHDDQVHDDCRIAALEAILADDARPTKRPRLA